MAETGCESDSRRGDMSQINQRDVGVALELSEVERMAIFLRRSIMEVKERQGRRLRSVICKRPKMRRLAGEDKE